MQSQRDAEFQVLHMCCLIKVSPRPCELRSARQRDRKNGGVSWLKVSGPRGAPPQTGLWRFHPSARSAKKDTRRETPDGRTCCSSSGGTMDAPRGRGSPAPSRTSGSRPGTSGEPARAESQAEKLRLCFPGPSGSSGCRGASHARGEDGHPAEALAWWPRRTTPLPILPLGSPASCVTSQMVSHWLYFPITHYFKNLRPRVRLERQEGREGERNIDWLLPYVPCWGSGGWLNLQPRDAPTAFWCWDSTPAH